LNVEPVLIVVSIIVIVGGIVIVAVIAERRAEKKRTEQLSQLAAEMAFSFEPSGDALLAVGLGRLPLFNRGHSRKTKNVLRKLVRGTEVIVLDHQYTIGHGKSRQTHKQTVVVFHPSDRADLPDFEMRPKSLFHRIGALFGYQDINFESHPKFSKSYLLRGNDESAIRAAFTPAVLEFFEQHPDKWSVEAHSAWIVIVRGNAQRSFRISSGPRRVDPTAIAQLLADATKVYLLFAPPTAAE
jgi:hypothetical protein